MKDKSKILILDFLNCMFVLGTKILSYLISKQIIYTVYIASVYSALETRFWI